MEKEANISVDLVTSDEMRQMAMAVRKQVFVKEQRIPESKEFDGNDYCAAHVIAFIQKGNRKLPIGTMRIRFFSNFVKFERMAVLKDFRKSGISDDIMKYGIQYAAEKGYEQVYGMCKKELLPRWEKCGYKPIENAPHVQQNGMELIPIQLTIPVNPQAIKMTSKPSLLTGLEGHWSEVREDENVNENDLSKLKAIFLKIKKIGSKQF